jgi:DNA-directed RNA polymerase subunit RPC12/RpoP
MPFPEKIKLEVKKKAAFRCCRCQGIGVQVHHIIPEHEGGNDDIENAAPLCAKCHTDFGDNEQKRKEIREMRNWWYEQAASMFKTVPDFEPILERIDKSVLEIQQQHTTNIANLKTALTELVTKDHEYLMKKIDSITPDTAQTDGSSIVRSTMYLVDSITADIKRVCANCGKQFTVINNEIICPTCRGK